MTWPWQTNEPADGGRESRYALRAAIHRLERASHIGAALRSERRHNHFAEMIAEALGMDVEHKPKRHR